MVRQPPTAELVDRALERHPRAVARLISLVEADSPRLRAVAEALAPHTGRARVIGITGPPGVGKSTTTSALVSAYRARGQRVGVLAVDPSSPFSGGALLGDRVRMGEHAADPDVFIRSMATRGHLGGLAVATPQALRVLDAAGFDVVLIETVGVGQSEVDVVALADCAVVLLTPGMGDGVQAAKAGILEIADVFAVNKADRDGAEATVRELKHAISLGRREIRGPSWRTPVVKTVAARAEGIADLVDAIEAHQAWAGERGEFTARRLARARAEIESIAVRELRSRLGELRGDLLDRFAAEVRSGTLDPYRAADDLIAVIATNDTDAAIAGIHDK
ncbi:methylmalonyl Co-A mutase-associated GTPase MeaB [Actinokineospora cianjurensis]|uniref:LAO/AO transport system kinase n=1 Tax=Actinokineospora cianjurensis TaxID=585224 RepID=A0A421AZX2_9PSEU|nr:methylmalonyl Co-A mutase-associated GTPase MeaB [Actinokineospora cianjurensis]RLK55359.1 LAO/AO transport system kinase [Actinokineospora cianjurensis]